MNESKTEPAKQTALEAIVERIDGFCHRLEISASSIREIADRTFGVALQDNPEETDGPNATGSLRCAEASLNVAFLKLDDIDAEIKRLQEL